MQKPENGFINAVHRKLPSEIHAEKMANPYRRGFPDVYYEGNKDILLVEYKWVDPIPPVIQPALSKLQEVWLKRAVENNRTVAVIVGSKSGGWIFEQRSWEHPLDRSKAMQQILSQDKIAAWIVTKVHEAT